MKPLTTGQQKVYDCILEGSENGRIPSVRELCDATGFRSTSTVAYHLKALEERGLIEREEGLNRCIRLKNEQPTSKVPLMGRVTAGQPILAVQDIETYIPVPKDISKGRELFALRVVGESMINAGISFALDKGKGFGTSKAMMARQLKTQGEALEEQRKATAEQEAKIRTLQEENAAIKEQNAKLAARLAAIEAKLGK